MEPGSCQNRQRGKNLNKAPNLKLSVVSDRGHSRAWIRRNLSDPYLRLAGRVSFFLGEGPQGILIIGEKKTKKHTGLVEKSRDKTRKNANIRTRKREFPRRGYQ